MLVLGVETSTRNGSVALVDSGKLLVERPLPDEGRRHAQTIVSEIDRILVECGRRKENVGRVGVSVGPGSFTGLRVGVVFAKTFASRSTGSPAEARTINSEGLRRRGFSSDSIHQLRRAFKILYRQGLTLELALQRLETMLSDTPEVQVLIDSIRASERGIVR